METMISNVSTIWEDLWERRDKRMDDYPLMSNPLHTAAICCVYFYLIIFAGPRYMKDRKPMSIRGFMIVYNALMVILSSYIVIQVRNLKWIIGIIAFQKIISRIIITNHWRIFFHILGTSRWMVEWLQLYLSASWFFR